MRPTRMRTALEVILGLALVTSITLNLRQFGRLTSCLREQAADLQSLRNLREDLRQRDLQKAPEITGEPGLDIEGRAAIAKRDATIKQLNGELSESKATLTQLQSQISNCSKEQEKMLASARESYVKEQRELQGRLDNLNQELENAQAESQASRSRVAALESDNAKLRSSVSGLSTSNAGLGGIITDLQDLNRRRDGHLTSIMRRYRDITNQFRAMSGMLDSSRDANCSALSGAALTDMHNAVDLADDDLRQLSELNARARQLEDKLKKELRSPQSRSN